jgi:hypothetical protein
MVRFDFRYAVAKKDIVVVPRDNGDPIVGAFVSRIPETIHRYYESPERRLVIRETLDRTFYSKFRLERTKEAQDVCDQLTIF